MKPRILFLADVNSSHTQKWAKSLALDGFKIGIFSLNKLESSDRLNHANIDLLYEGNKVKHFGSLSKLSYLLVLPRLIYFIFKYKPSIIHAHYATSYGLLGALVTVFSPLFVSVWGSDLLDFPNKGFFHKLAIKFVFFRAKKICVTSSLLKKEITKYTSKQALVIPFGIDLDVFYDFHLYNNSSFTFGCIKHLEKIYNIDKVILAFNLLLKKYNNVSVKLLLVGDGKERESLKALVKFYNLTDHVIFAGAVNHKSIPWFINKLDVLVNVSEMESFGVSVGEAMACKTPVIVSNLEGFHDLVPDEKIGLITKSTGVEDIFNCMEKYFLNRSLRVVHAEEAFKHVTKHFDWNKNVLEMESVYAEVV
jgi:glycosyltransferase involved in cell wall biosynthesis